MLTMRPYCKVPDYIINLKECQFKTVDFKWGLHSIILRLDRLIL